ncbi:hypothetical protein GCM10010329_05750 [Streptomyces spiroverticillatus]|uniref:Uncharacterized protein n=1 Tax=Streptomyces finlayi TaxID=67296 RepID=A0A919C729_9ACTN|nr:hypothetical protein [Streptomyces finlayi]GGZ88467.1 hypothetical protein GCM10010329_05750 [Streptomyces spiroverticillatus]GHC79475.1 hypothetical protein GCM10010334_05730 [Streptomyces finlayi]
MSYSAPPPQQPGGNPYGQAPGPYGQPQQPNQFPQGQFPGQQPQGGQFGGGFGGGYPQPPVRRGNVGLGLLAGLGVALVGAVVYGLILGKADFQIGWLTFGIGFATGLVAAKLGGRNPLVIVASVVISLFAVYVGQILGIAIAVSDSQGLDLMSVLTKNFAQLNELFKLVLDEKPIQFLFFGLGGVGAFAGAKKAS